MMLCAIGCVIILILLQFGIKKKMLFSQGTNNINIQWLPAQVM